MVTLRSEKGGPLTRAEIDANFAEIRQKAASDHGHAIGDVAGLQTALEGLQDALNGRAAAAHGHAIGDVVGLQAALDGLQTALNGKAASAHGHAIGDVTGLQAALDAKPNAASPSTSGALTHSGPATFGDAFGYGSGAGGAVTQITSKSTAVTLNKASGRITMHNAALAASASVVFTLNNSKVSANDLLLVGGAASANYDVRCLSTNAGTAVIRVTNISAGALSEAVAINFAIIEGVAS